MSWGVNPQFPSHYTGGRVPPPTKWTWAKLHEQGKDTFLISKEGGRADTTNQNIWKAKRDTPKTTIGTVLILDWPSDLLQGVDRRGQPQEVGDHGGRQEHLSQPASTVSRHTFFALLAKLLTCFAKCFDSATSVRCLLIAPYDARCFDSATSV